MSSSLFKFLLHIYSFVLELEYSLEHDICNAYELGYSPYEHCSLCSSMFFIVHMFYIVRGGDLDGVMVCSTFRFALVLACPSVGWGSMGDMGSSLVCERGVWMRGNLQI